MLLGNERRVDLGEYPEGECVPFSLRLLFFLLLGRLPCSLGVGHRVNLALGIFVCLCLCRQHIRQGLCDDVVHASPGHGGVGAIVHNSVGEPRHKLLLHFPLHGIVEETRVVEPVEDVAHEAIEITPCERLRSHLLPHRFLPFHTFFLLCDAPHLFLHLADLCSLHALQCHELCVAKLLKVLLVSAHSREFLLLHDLHQTLLKSLADKDLKDGLHLKVKVEEVAVLNLCLDVDANLHRDEERRRRSIHERIRLRRHIRLGDRVHQFLEVLFRLYVHVPSAFDGLGCPRRL